MSTNSDVLQSFLEVGVPRNDFKTLLQIVSAEVRERIQQHDEEVARFDNLIGDAPELLNTLGELSDALGDDPQFFATLAAQVAELNTDVTATVTAMGIAENDTSMGTFSESVLPDGADLKAVLEAFAVAWRTAKDNIEAAANTIETNLATEVTNRTNADTALSDRLDVLEADPTTQALLDAETTDRTTADNALSGRLDVLEADPITATDAASADATVLSTANTYTDTSITNLVNGADLALDTLKEIGDALQQGDDDVTTALTNQITTEATTRSNADTALSGRLDVLEADPTTQTLLDAETTARSNADTTLSGRLDVLEADPVTATYVDSADGALSTRLDVLEADPTTATAVAAVQSDVDQNEADADAALLSLDGRLGVLEADPTTATAVAAVQADVDQNEADADAALALKAPLADPDFTGQLDVDTNARIEFADNLTKIQNVLRGTSINIGNNIELKPAAAGGRVEITGDLIIDASDFTDAVDDTAAAAAGVVVGQVYRNGSQLMVRVS